MIKFHWLLRAFVCLFSCALQSADQKEPLSKEWVALAHDLALGKIGYFHWLPLEIHANIFSRINPEPALDDWYSNNLLCIKHITVPDFIGSFDIKGDRLAYMGKKNKNFLSYKPYWIDLKTDNYYSPCVQRANHVHTGEEVPRVELCGDVILFEGYTNYPVAKDLSAVNVFDTGIGHYPLLQVCILGSHDIWKAHKLNSLLVILEKANISNTFTFYEVTDSIKKHSKAIKTVRNFGTFSWNPCLSQLCTYSQLTSEACFLSVKPDTIDIHPSKVSFENKPHFSQDGLRLYAKNLFELVEFEIEPEKVTSRYISEKKNKFLLRGVGNFTYLVEESDAQGHGTAAYSLRSLNDGSGVDVSLTELSNLPPLHKLPSGGDYRLVTIVPDEESGTSTIKIMVPQLPILFQHYCMLKAVLEAGKEKNDTAYDIFDAQENKVLVAETETACPRFRARHLQTNLKDEPLDD